MIGYTAERRARLRRTSAASPLRQEYPDVEICACLGLLTDGQAERLNAAGVDAYNHNINTAESHHHNIVSTHTYADRIDTVEKAKGAGLSPCSGLIAGLGETDQQLVEALFALKDLGADSIPVNFLMPFDGTPLENTWTLSPTRCVKILAMARFVCPDKEIRIAGGREIHLRSLQSIAIQVANSVRTRYGSLRAIACSWRRCCTDCRWMCCVGCGCWCVRTRCCAGTATYSPAATRLPPSPNNSVRIVIPVFREPECHAGASQFSGHARRLVASPSRPIWTGPSSLTASFHMPSTALNGDRPSCVSRDTFWNLTSR